MRQLGSHGRRKTYLILAVAVGLPLVVGVYSAIPAVESARSEIARGELREMQNEARILAESVWSEIEVIRTRAESLHEIRSLLGMLPENKASAAPNSPILHWAEFSLKNGRLMEVRQRARNSAWSVSESFETNYLTSVEQHLDVEELAKNGLAVLRVKQDPERLNEWLALAFPTSASGDIVLVALVDPAQAFPAIKQWLGKNSESPYRAYLIGSNGYVLAHTRASYVATDFSRTPIYQGAIGAAFAGGAPGGAGIFEAVDGASTAAAYLRMGRLPFALVVERVRPGDAGFGWARIIERALGSAALLFVLSILAFLRFARTAPRDERARVETSAPFPTQVPAPAPDDILRLEELPETTESVRELAAPTKVSASSLPRTPPPSPIAVQFEGPPSREKLLLIEFERECAERLDVKAAARRITSLASRIFESPALFFVYHPGVHAGILQAWAGFSSDDLPGGMSFAIGDAIHQQAAEARGRGAVLSLSAYPPLARLLHSRMAICGFQAWALIGSDGLLGVLCAIQSEPDSRMVTPDVLAQMVKHTGQTYENALISP